ncbi:MAG: hypothetical protein M1823_007662, partial [Watsoniomyces obsoletus]
DDFARAQEDLVGSVSRKELEHFVRIRGLFEEQDISASSGGLKPPKIEETSKLPFRPTPVASEASGNLAMQASHANNQHVSAGAKKPGYASLHGMQNSLTTKQVVDGKGKGKAAPAPQRNNSKSYLRRIGNPDSGASSSDELREIDAHPDADGFADADVSAAGESDFGISNHNLGKGLNGRLMNGDIKGKGKEKDRMAEFHEGGDNEDD